MAGDPYFSTGSSGGGDPYFGGGKTSKKSKPPHKAHGVGGFFENLGHDVVQSAYGIPAGIKASVEHPLRTGKQFAKAESATWSPLFHGHVGEFAHNTYHRPLTPLLDIATVATLPFGIGEGLAGSRIARLALAPGERGLDYTQVIAKNPIMRASQRMGDAYRHGEVRSPRELADEGRFRRIAANEEDLSAARTGRQTYERTGKMPRRFVQAQFDKMFKKLPPNTWLVGELRRHARLARKASRDEIRAFGQRIDEYEMAARKLKEPEKWAVRLHLTHVDPEKYAALLEARAATKAEAGGALKDIEDALDEAGISAKKTKPERLIQILRSPEFKAAYESAGRNPRLDYAIKIGRKMSTDMTEMRLDRAHRIHAKLVDEATGNEKRVKALDQDLAETERVLAERPYLHLRLLEGATFERPIAATKGVRVARQTVDRLKNKVAHLNNLEATKAKSFDRSDWVTSTEALQEAQSQLDKLEQRHANKLTGGNLNEYFRREGLKHPQLIDTDNSTIAAIKEKLAAEGKDEPVYFPDVTDEAMERIPNLRRVRGGVGVPKVEDAMRQNKGVLFMAGALSLNPEVLALGYRQLSSALLKEAIHDELIDNAVRLSQKPAKGWVNVKEYATQHLTSPDVIKGEMGDVRSLARTEEWSRRYGASDLYVPENLANELAGEFVRSSNFIRALFEKPTTVWRAIVLNLRVGYLTNNVLGQMFLLHYHYFGPSMLEAWGAFIKEQMPTVWPRFQRVVMRRNVEMPDRPFTGALREWTPSQYYGTQYRTQVPGMDITEQSGYARRGREGVEEAKRLSKGVAGASARFSEDIPRNVAMRTMVIREAKRRGIWEHRLVYDPEKFTHLADEIMADPKFAERAVGEANSALGDYLSMNSFERGIIRQIVPFYGWLRAITKITLNSAIDTPGRTLLMAGLGKIGAEIVNEQLAAGIGQPRLPEYMLYLLPLGKHHVLSTKGANPWATLPDVIHAATGLVHGKPADTGRAIAPVMNPFVKAFVENLSGKQLVTGKDVKARGGLLGGVLWQNVKELPPVRLGSAVFGHPEYTTEPSKYFGQTNALRELGSYVGVPLRAQHPRVRPKKKGRNKKVSDPYFG